MGLNDCCLASQEIRELVKRGVIVDSNFDESRIQPSSFEPTIGDEMFLIDTYEGLFKPREVGTVYNALLKIPKRRRQEISILDGAEARVGFSYLIPLEQRIRFDGFRLMKSSPKSSIGRVFPKTRLLTDYNFSFDEALYRGDNKELMMWLLFQPQAFNLIVFPGASLNQLRFMKGFDAQLTPGEIKKMWETNPILYSNEEGTSIVNPDMGESLQVHVDLEGRGTEGIVALRARRNPNPIDLRGKGLYVSEDYFDPMKAEGEVLNVKRGEHYLFSSKEVLKIPACINVELRARSHQGIDASLHEAGYVDNGFEGDLVYEVTSNEGTDLKIHDGMTFGELAVFRTDKPDKLYGKDIGSNYKFQVGPKVAKYFKSFDYVSAARNHKKLDREVLVQEAEVLKSVRRGDSAFEFIDGVDESKLIELIEKDGFFHSRYDCEEDELVLQVIPYVLGFGPNRTIFSYVRSSDIQDYGDKRLFGKHSLGLGGHINRLDAPNFIRRGIEREVNEEEVKVVGHVTEPILLGTLYQPDKPVDRVHFGLVYGFCTDGKISQKESSIVSGKMVPIGEILSDSNLVEIYEMWSKVLIPHLSRFYKMVAEK